MLMGLVVPLFGSQDVSTDEAVVYAPVSIGTFGALGWLAESQGLVDRVSLLAGIGFPRPVATVCVAIFMLFLAGIPPLAGFRGKFFLFWSAISLGLSTSFPSMSLCFIILAVVGVLNAVIGTGYDLRRIAVMYFSAEGGEQKRTLSPPLLGLCSCDVDWCNSGPGSRHWPWTPDEGNSWHGPFGLA